MVDLAALAMLLAQETSKPQQCQRALWAGWACYFAPFWPVLLVVLVCAGRRHLRPGDHARALVGQSVDCYLTPGATARCLTEVGSADGRAAALH